MVSERGVATSFWQIDQRSGGGLLDSTARDAAVIRVIPPDRRGGQQPGSDLAHPDPEGSKGGGHRHESPEEG